MILILNFVHKYILSIYFVYLDTESSFAIMQLGWKKAPRMPKQFDT